MGINHEYAKFIESFDWDYFLTIRSPYKITTMTPRKWTAKLFQNSKKINSLFYVRELDKSDYSSSHVHMLISTTDAVSYSEFKSSFGNIYIGDYQRIYNKKYVSNYITKYIGMNIDYDFELR